MRLNTYITTSLIVLTSISFANCKKSNSKKTSCVSTVHAYSAVINPLDTSVVYACSHGILNLSTGGIATSGTITTSMLFTNQGAFNTSDNCYYVFQNAGYSNASASLLYRVDASGATNMLVPADTGRFVSLTYNEFTHKFYCIRNGALVELNTTSTTYTTTNLVTPVHPFLPQPFSPTNIAVDNATGNMYYATTDSVNNYVEKFNPSGASSAVIASGGSGSILEMRYNSNDNMLYALNTHAATYSESVDFIKINPSTGTITTIVVALAPLNPDQYSATLDPCSNRYLLSTTAMVPVGPGPYILRQVNMTGSIIQTDTTVALYQGLTAY